MPYPFFALLLMAAKKPEKLQAKSNKQDQSNREVSQVTLERSLIPRGH